MHAGAPLPPFSLTAAVSGRPVSPEALAGRRAVLVVHGPATADAAKALSKALRARWPSARDLLLVSVVDLRSMGGLWRRVAEAQLRQTYERLAGKVRDSLPGEVPEDHVLICPDWDGAAVAALGAAAPNERAHVVAVGGDGRVRVAAERPEPEAVVQALAA